MKKIAIRGHEKEGIKAIKYLIGCGATNPCGKSGVWDNMYYFVNSANQIDSIRKENIQSLINNGYSVYETIPNSVIK